MPTKLNRAGEQQNYVPSGNGDASGEYGDNATGSNKHFKQFAKPSEQKQETYWYKNFKGWQQTNNKNTIDMLKLKNIKIYTDDEYQAELSKEKSESPKRKKYNNLKESLESSNIKTSKMFKENVLKNYELGQEEGKSLILNAINDGNISFDKGTSRDKCYMSNGLVVLTATSFGTGRDSDYYSKGGIFYHECGHALDGNYIDYSTNKGWVERKDRRLGNYTEPPEGASSSFITSTGLTLRETLQQGKNYKDIYLEIKKDIEQAEQEYYKKNYPDVEKYNSEIKKIEEEVETELKNSPEYLELKKKRDDVMQRISNADFGTNTMSLQREHRELYNRLNEMEYNYKKEEKRQLRDKIAEAKFNFHSYKNRIYGDVSDMLCMNTRGMYYFGMGHKGGYSSQKDNARAEEFFAECFSAENTNPESLEKIKKYFPDGYKAYREIIDAIKNNKIPNVIGKKEKTKWKR